MLDATDWANYLTKMWDAGDDKTLQKKANDYFYGCASRVKKNEGKLPSGWEYKPKGKKASSSGDPPPAVEEEKEKEGDGQAEGE